MRIAKFYSGVIPLISILLVLAITASAFMLRRPVVVVTEPEFNMVYGTFRSIIKQAELSIKYFRRITQIPVTISAGPEIVAAAVDSVSSSPYIVFLPGFFASAANKYLETKPDIPVFILAGRSRAAAVNKQDGPPYYVYTDTQTDLYSAGVCAAYLAGENNGAGTGIMLVQDEILSSALRQIFEDGLRAGGFIGAPRYLENNSDFSIGQTCSCAVIIGSPARFFELNPKLPVILFSWLDPDMTPSNVRIIFDDSLWAAADEVLQVWKDDPTEILGGNPGNQNTFVPSHLTVPWGRGSEGEVFYGKISAKKTVPVIVPVN
ncbi:MAG: hypothetical protein FWD78_13090 [Treponema sp.]|nr:hypothetical protein [Treponema sp.]